MLPNFLIIGAMKAGTGSLWHYLRQHPAIFMPSVKELDFFVEEKNWKRGWDWYERQFRKGQNGVKASGEASTNYSKFPVFSGVPERIASGLPDARLIYLVRHPIERIRSMYVHLVHTGRESRTFFDAMANLDNNHYVELSLYNFQLQQYLHYFSLEKILIVASEDLRNARRDTLRGVFRFLGVDESFECAAFDELVNRSLSRRRTNTFGKVLQLLPDFQGLLGRMPETMRSKYVNAASSAIPKPKVTEALRARFAEVLEPDAQRLRDLSGQSIRSWSL